MYDHICVSIDDDDGRDCLGTIRDHDHLCWDGESPREDAYYSDHCCAGCGCRQGPEEEVVHPCERTGT
jgi:hypothetical protein